MLLHYDIILEIESEILGNIPVELLLDVFGTFGVVDILGEFVGRELDTLGDVCLSGEETLRPQAVNMKEPRANDANNNFFIINYSFQVYYG